MSLAPRAIGPYRILRVLGKGGMGVVYEAEHPGGARVALKTLHLPSVAMAGTIRREIQSLARLSHPGIVRIIDHGDHEGLPWYAMELLADPSLRNRMRGSRTTGAAASTSALPGASLHDTEPLPSTPEAPGDDEVPPPVRPMPYHEALTIAARMCVPLSYLHGVGVVHRDLKPDNVVVKADGTTILVDFGLASRFGGEVARETLDVMDAVTGTAAYMSPEQWRGEVVDARADIYALGCILYELVAGRPPFLASTIGEMLALHLHATPEPPSRIATGAPSGIDALVLRLIAKDARDRIGYADLVAAALIELGAEAVGDIRARPYLYRAALAGRDLEMRGLAARLDAMLRDGGRKQTVLVGGESGVGKTRLLSELAQIAVVRGIRVIPAECAPDARAPLAAFRPLLRTVADRQRERGASRGSALPAHAVAVLLPYEPALAAIAGTEGPSLPDLPPQETMARIAREIARALEVLLHDGPLLLMIDDLQWADDLSAEICRRIAGDATLAAAPFGLVLGYRSEEMTPIISSLLEQAAGSALPLARIETEGVASMVRDMLALQRTPEAFVRFLARHSEGNPFFVSEYLKTAVSEGLLARDARGAWRIAATATVLVEDDASRLPIPHSVRQLVSARLAMVDAPARAVLEVAAAIGRDAERPILAAAMVLAGGSLTMDAIGAIRERGMVDEAPDGTLRFTHDKIREIVLEGLAAGRRRRLHRAAARASETLYPGNAGKLAEITRLWDEGGRPRIAAPYYYQAARYACERFAFGDAERLFRARIRVADDDSRESLHASVDFVGHVLLQSGRVDEAEASIRSTLARAQRAGDRESTADALRLLATVLQHTGRIAESRDVGRRSLSVVRELGDRDREGAHLAMLASIEHDMGDMASAWTGYESALLLHREVGDDRSAATCLANMALLAQQQGLVTRATALFEDALAAASSTGNRILVGSTLGNLALLHQAAGRMGRARECFENALAIHREVGNRRFEGGALGNLGKLHLDQGRLGDAERLFDEALAIHREVGNRTHAAVALANLGLLRRAEGRLEESRQLCEQAIAALRELHDVQREGNRLADLGKVLQDMGRLSEARAAYDASLEIARRVGNRQREGIVLRDLAGLERIEGADPATIATLLGDAQATLAAAGADAALVELDCERGHAELAEARGAERHLARAEERLAALGAGPESLRAIAVAKLRRAQDAFHRSEPLRRGLAIADFPPGLDAPVR
ncbi:MAG: tetratricopeptide repeat protein [Acidobacteriota bacterium]